jgi:heme-degrading monooxygenase HmoA
LVLSLSTWRDEKAVVRWRSHGEHHRVQEKGRGGIFSDYHLRVCEVTADSHPPAGTPVVEQRFDVTTVGAAEMLTITELTPSDQASFAQFGDQLRSHLRFDRHAEGLVDYDIFESIYTPGKMLVLASWRTDADAARWNPQRFAGVADLRHRRVRVIRDYGMFERREAAQYYPEAQRHVGA